MVTDPKNKPKPPRPEDVLGNTNTPSTSTPTQEKPKLAKPKPPKLEDVLSGKVQVGKPNQQDLGTMLGAQPIPNQPAKPVQKTRQDFMPVMKQDVVNTPARKTAVGLDFYNPTEVFNPDKIEAVKPSASPYDRSNLFLNGLESINTKRYMGKMKEANEEINNLSKYVQKKYNLSSIDAFEFVEKMSEIDNDLAGYQYGDQPVQIDNPEGFAPLPEKDPYQLRTDATQVKRSGGIDPMYWNLDAKIEDFKQTPSALKTSLKSFANGVLDMRTGLDATGVELIKAFGGEEWDKKLDQAHEEFKKSMDSSKYDINEFESQTAQLIGSAAPSFVPIVAGVGTSIYNPVLGGQIANVGFATLSASSAGNYMDNYRAYQKEKGEEIDPVRMYSGAIGTAAVEYFTERMGFGGRVVRNGQLLRRSATQITPDKAEKLGVAVLQQFKKTNPAEFKKLIKDMGVTANKEGFSEAIATLGQEAIENSYKYLEDKSDVNQIFKGMVDSYKVGAIMSGAVGPLSYKANNKFHQERRKNQGGVLVVESEGNAYEVLRQVQGKEGVVNYEVMTPEGDVTQIQADKVNESYKLSPEQFENIVNGKATESEAVENSRVELAKETQKQIDEDVETSLAEFSFEVEGERFVMPANFEGVPVFVLGKKDKNTFLISDRNTGAQQTVHGNRLSDIKRPMTLEQVKQAEKERAGVAYIPEGENIKPPQIGEQYSDPNLGNLTVLGYNPQTGDVTVKVGEGLTDENGKAMNPVVEQLSREQFDAIREVNRQQNQEVEAPVATPQNENIEEEQAQQEAMPFDESGNVNFNLNQDQNEKDQNANDQKASSSEQAQTVTEKEGVLTDEKVQKTDAPTSEKSGEARPSSKEGKAKDGVSDSGKDVAGVQESEQGRDRGTVKESVKDDNARTSKKPEGDQGRADQETPQGKQQQDQDSSESKLKEDGKDKATESEESQQRSDQKTTNKGGNKTGSGIPVQTGRQVNETSSNNQPSTRTKEDQRAKVDDKAKPQSGKTDGETKSVTKVKRPKKKNPVTEKLSKATPSDVRQSVMQHFALGGRVNTESLVKETGMGAIDKNGNRRKKTEYNKRIWMHSKSAPGIDSIVQSIVEEMDANVREGVQEDDVRNTIIDVINSYDSKGKMRTDLMEEFSVRGEVVFDPVERTTLKQQEQFEQEVLGQLTDQEQAYLENNPQDYDAVYELTEEEAQKLLDNEKEYNEWLSLQDESESTTSQEGDSRQDESSEGDDQIPFQRSTQINQSIELSLDMLPILEGTDNTNATTKLKRPDYKGNKKKVEKKAKELMKGWKNPPQLIVYESHLDLQANMPWLANQARQQMGNLYGFSGLFIEMDGYPNGVVIMVASAPKFTNRKGSAFNKSVANTLFHESFAHAGLSGWMNQLAKEKGTSKKTELRNLLDSLVDQMDKDTLNEVTDNYTNGKFQDFTKVKSKDQRYIILEEYIAKRAEERADDNVVQQVIEWIKDQLAILGWDGLIDEADVRRALIQSKRFITVGDATVRKPSKFKMPKQLSGYPAMFQQIQQEEQSFTRRQVLNNQLATIDWRLNQLNSLPEESQSNLVKEEIAALEKEKQRIQSNLETALSEDEARRGGEQMAMFQIDAYHGSPHLFSRFSTDHIGSGAGKQRFGWGLYFTNKEGIAKVYGNMTSKPVLKEVDPPGFIKRDQVEKALKQYGGKEGLIKTVQNMGRFTKSLKIDDNGNTVRLSDKKAFVEYLEKNVEQERVLYKTTLHKNKPDNYDYLRWNEAISTTQAEKIKKYFGSATFAQEALQNLTGAELYENLTNHFGSQKEASMNLLKAGVDGIEFPNNLMIKGSDGTNYVVFDENEVSITETVRFQKTPEIKSDAPRIMFQLSPEYGMDHRPPNLEYGSPLHDVTKDGEGAYPEDFYGPNGLRYYGMPNDVADRESYNAIRSAQGNPEKEVTIYRAVPKDLDVEINSGDWVSLSKTYVKEHGERYLDDNYKIITKKVKAKTLVTDGNSLNEFGYWDENNPDIRFQKEPKDTKFEDYETERKDGLRQGTYQNPTRDDLKNAFDYLSRGLSSVGPDEQVALLHKNAKEYAQANGLLVDPNSLAQKTDKGGTENMIYINVEKGEVYKSNNLFVHKGNILSHLNYIQRHNYLFPDTAYEFVGFEEITRNKELWMKPVVKQAFIRGEGVRKATLEEIDAHMRSMGYFSNGRKSFSYENGVFEISDLKPANVLYKDGEIFVVDNISKRFSLEDTRFQYSSEGIDYNNPIDNFYSNTLRAINQINQPKATGEQWKAMLLKTGASQAELDWIGFDQFVESNKKPTKEEVVSFISNNQIEIEEVVKGDFTEKDQVIEQLAEKGISVGEFPDGTNFYNEDGEIVYPDEFDDEQKALVKRYYEIKINDKLDTKYSQYTLPGGENYKELLLTMPKVKRTLSFEEYLSAYKNRFPQSDASEDEIRTWYNRGINVPEQGRSTGTHEGYSSSHWDEPNILAHIRLNDRVVDGQKVLFVEELQSDWQADGRKKGFKGQKSDTEILADKFIELGYGILETPDGKFIPYKDDPVGGALYPTKFKRDDIEFKLLSELDRATGDIKQSVKGGVPDMPFKTTPQWVNLSLRRIIRMASEEGYDRVAFISGEQSAERYDLSKQVDSLEYNSGTQRLYGYQNRKRVVEQENVTEDNLEDYVGKEVAKRLLTEGKNWDNKEGGASYSLEGEQLKVGGEGMKDFYNKIVPAQAKKVLGKLDKTVKVEVIDLEGTAIYNRDNTSVKERANSWLLFDEDNNQVAAISKEATEGMNGKNIHLELIDLGNEYSKSKKGSQQLSFPISPAIREIALREGMPMFQKNPQVEESGAAQLSRLDRVRAAHQDSMLYLKMLQENAKNNDYGFVDDESDAYSEATLYQGRIKDQYHRVFRKNYMDPLKKLLLKVQKENGVDYDTISRYLKAKHIVADNIEKGGIEMDEAKKLVEDFEGKVPKAEVKQINDYVRMMTHWDLQMRYEYGLITEDQFKTLSGMYTHYVPLKGWESVTMDDETKFSVMKDRKGRSTESADPLAYIDVQTHSTLIMGEKNRFKQAFLNFAERNPDSRVYNIKNVWYVQNEDGSWRVQYTNPGKQLIKEGKARQTAPDTDNMSAEELLKHYANVKLGGRERELTVYKNGNPVVIELVSSDLARVFKKQPVTEQNSFMDSYRAVYNYMRAVRTQYSPEFGPVNLLRDVTFGINNVFVDRGLKMAIEVLNDVTLKNAYSKNSSMRVLRRAIFNNDFSGEGMLFREFLENGGSTGWSDLKEVRKIYSNMKSEVEGFKKKSRYTGIPQLLEFVDKSNEVIENTVRFATYRALRKRGISAKSAAIYAKDLTVNFNRKGQNSFFNSYFMFFNAGVQGSERLLRPYGSNDKNTKLRLAGSVAGIMATQATLAMLSRILGGEDDEGNYYYDMLPEYTRSFNWVLPNIFSDEEGDFLYIPKPYGLNFYATLADHIDRGIRGVESPGQAATGILTGAANAFIPVDIASEEDNMTALGGLFKTITPTVLKPQFELMVNRNFAGSSIYKEPFMQNETPWPDSEMYFKNVSPIAKGIASGLNKATGGDEVTPGAIDINPESLEHYYESYTGGVGKFFSNSYTFTNNLVTGGAEKAFDVESRNINKVPFVRKFVGSNPEYYYEQEKFYQNLEMIKNAETRMKRYEKYIDEGKSHLYPIYKDYMKRNAGLIDYNRDVKKIEEEAKELREERQIYERKGDEKKLMELEDKFLKLFKSVNSQVEKLQPK